MPNDYDDYDAHLRVKAITAERLYLALGELLKEHPEIREWPVYADGCDCTGPAAQLEMNAKAAVGPLLLLVRVPDN
jgi:hypothetical protein